MYIISGERSGDLHASNLVKELKRTAPGLQLRGIGGNYSQEAGVELYKSYSEISWMGFVEVFLNIRKILAVMRAVQEDILHYQPEAVILVDFGGFNMKMAKFLKEKNIKVIYYISPKIWAWNQKRAYKIKKYVDLMLVVMPFEPDFYKKFEMEVTYVGNPVNDAVHQHVADPEFRSRYDLDNRPILAVLAGSRKQEVQVMLHTMLVVAQRFPEYQSIVAAVGNLPDAYYDACRQQGIRVITDDTYNVLSHASLAVVTSGTASLETALFKVPQVVVYKTNWLTYQIAKRLVTIPFVSLPNLIADKQVVAELLQGEYTPDKVEQQLRYLASESGRIQVLNGYSLIQERLGKPGASGKAAQSVFSFLKM
ncbi:MAG: lipid-A-disaccharide synthase [Cytophagaceae bacterium]|nr:lipid-A-disaccharide synthase [Cytophagaceae bacterium]